ncbi:P-loop containing nucleoside triphosphate hydrolase protein [Lipomyces tetrasporus]|uniref:RNA helicase n=1 Tax=Lipomyces tetrasporus TaxID=54092 RepID=A0AAD7QMY6_9ASCO|nr:P-loop containing nucleoside triphosphate hydrolase protein [Lipomyces tetrasporus]KAJ8098315.1 P-loop containing nucleoside triphosphate hydrolase protein [Lipomyces tetrasporus]
MSTFPSPLSAAKRKRSMLKVRSNLGKRPVSSLLQSSRPKKRKREYSKSALSDIRDDDEHEILDASKLAWQPVMLPERVGDLEGLMGFEEIEGVDVEYEHAEGGKERIVKFRKAKSSVKEEVSKGTKMQEKKKKKEEEEKGKKNSTKPATVAAFGEPVTKSTGKSFTDKKKKVKRKTERVRQRAKVSDIGEESNIFGALDPEETETELPAWAEIYPLSESLLHGLSDLGFSAPTDIQRKTIPLVMAGHDLVGKAATGSGKTLAFGLAILEKYLASSISVAASSKNNMTFSSAPSPTALILAPTRELVHQISDHITTVSKYTPANIVSITGGLAIQKQRRQLNYFPNVVVATAGRLHELLTTDTEGLIRWLAGVEMLVLDEADRLLQEGHFKELDEILDMIGQNGESDSESSDAEDGTVNASRSKNKRQTLVFSATFEKDLTRKLTTTTNNANGKKPKRRFVNNNIEGKNDTMAYLLDKLNFREITPQYVDVNPDEAVKREVVEGVITCEALEKDVYLYYFLLKYPGRTIVFVNNIDAVKRIARFLQELSVPAVAFHSRMIQKQRLRTIERFKDNDSAVLVSTDVAARGLDIPRVQHVLHYHLPRSADIYVHRSGRTARGTARGVAMILCARTETQQLKQMAQKLGKNVKELRIFDVEKKVVRQLESRVSLAREINALDAKSSAANTAGKKKRGKGGDVDSALLREGAEDLGLDVSEIEQILAASESDDNDDAGARQRSTKHKERDRTMLQRLRKDLKMMISQPVVTGSMVSRNYITSGLINLAQQLVDGTGHESFLGETKTTALDDVSKSRRQRNKKLEQKK